MTLPLSTNSYVLANSNFFFYGSQ